MNTEETANSDLGAVSGSISLTAKIPPKFAQAVIDLHKEHNVQLVSNEVLTERGFRDDGWRKIVVTGIKDNLVKLNKACSDIAYGDVPYYR
ncbi:MAG: hypothetical protein WD512_06505 [Candidatus Paceibacterota bacterium]